MKVYKNVSELIGKTPLLELTSFEKDFKLKANIYAKLECMNPAGSIKDRAAFEMIKDAEEKGILKKGSVIVEPTSGNTGIGLASIGAAKGYNVILTMPDTMSVERRNLLKSFGAKIILTDGSLGMKGAICKAEEIVKNTPGAFLPGQFDNIANAKSHYLTTGPEIWEDTAGKIDVLVSGIGTRGTIIAIGKYIKEKNRDIKIVGFEPDDSPYLTKGISGPHKIQGIGAGFKPTILDENVIDEILTVKYEDAKKAANFMAKNEGILVGITSGGAVHIAAELAKKKEYEGKRIVAILPDSGERYLSCGLFE